MTKFFNKFKKPCSEPIFGPFSQFWGQNRFFLENPTLSGTTSYGFLEPCPNLEKTNDIIPRKSPYRRMNGRTEGQKGGQTLFHRIKKTKKNKLRIFYQKIISFLSHAFPENITRHWKKSKTHNTSIASSS